MPSLFLILWAVLCVLVGAFWFTVNSATSTVGWSFPVIVMWYIGFPVILSAGLAGAISAKFGF